MKIQHLLFASFATVAVAAIAGCPGGPSTTPQPTPGATATPAPTPTPYTRTSGQQLIVQNVTFTTSATESLQPGEHYITIKNLTNTAINLNDYMIAVNPTGSTGNAVATASIVTAAGAAFGNLGATGSIRVYLFTGATPQASVEAETDANLAPQLSRGGGLAIFRTKTATTSANTSDFVQWGTTGTTYESVAAGANLWTAGTTVATPSTLPAGTTQVRLGVKTEGGVGANNWTATTR